MHAVVVYESMFGNTHEIAQHIAEGIDTVVDGPVQVLPVHEATEEVIAGSDLVVVGGPTHVHGMSNSRSRAGAVDMAGKDDDLELDPDAEGPGLREWFDGLAAGDGRPAAAFDTRVHGTAFLTGQASKGITKRLHRHGFDVIVEHESFFVDTDNHLEADENERAASWGRAVARAAVQTVR